MLVVSCDVIWCWILLYLLVDVVGIGDVLMLLLVVFLLCGEVFE